MDQQQHRKLGAPGWQSITCREPWQRCTGLFFSLEYPRLRDARGNDGPAGPAVHSIYLILENEKKSQLHINRTGPDLSCG